MLWSIIVITFSMFMARYASSFMHMSLLDRPIFLGFLVGLLLGDMKTGILIGAQLELAFLGIVTIGAGQAADTRSSTVITVALSILNDIPIETVIPLGMTLGYAMTVLDPITLLIVEMFVPTVEKALHEDNESKFIRVGYFGTIAGRFIIPILVCNISVLVGGSLIESFINSLPAFVLAGIGAAGAMLPALGISMILSLILNRQTAIYFLPGFVIYKYLEVDMIFMLVIGLTIAVADFFITSEVAGKGMNAANSAVLEEEEFLS